MGGFAHPTSVKPEVELRVSRAEQIGVLQDFKPASETRCPLSWPTQLAISHSLCSIWKLLDTKLYWEPYPRSSGKYD